MAEKLARQDKEAGSSVPARRALAFDEIAQIVPDVEHLAQGHRTCGNWTLAQICKHLADSFNGSMDGFDLRRHRIKRFFLRKSMLHIALTRGIPRNYTVDPNITPPANVSLEPAMKELCEAVDRYQAHKGRLHAHPLFGKLSRDLWDRVHRVHCAHHLSFARCDDESRRAGADD